MKGYQKLFVNTVDKLFFIEKKILKKPQMQRLYRYISKLFEEEAVHSYLSDKQDIGFFETFIIGSDETKKISKETDNTFRVMRQLELKEKLAGYIPSSSRKRNENEEVVKENIYNKKIKVIEILKEKDEVIKYMGRRIVTHNEKLYFTLERIYSQLENILDPNHGDPSQTKQKDSEKKNDTEKQ